MSDETKTISIEISASMRYVLLMMCVDRGVEALNRSYKASKKAKGTDIAFLNEAESLAADLARDIATAKRLYDQVVAEGQL